MRRTRLSITGLLGIIVVAAVGLALLRVADAVWAGVAHSVAMIATLVAVLGAMFAVGERRAACGGFAVFCGAYLILVFSPLSTALDSATYYPGNRVQPERSTPLPTVPLLE